MITEGRGKLIRMGMVGLCVVSMIGCGQQQPPAAPPAAPDAAAVAPAAAPAAEPAPAIPAAGAGLVADFSSTDKRNKLGGEFGGWGSADKDPVGRCDESVVAGAGVNGGGAWKLNIDISNAGSYAGSWMKLNNFDASKYTTFSIVIKGEGTFSPKLKIDLKADNNARVGTYVIDGITNEYKTFDVPLSSFSGLGAANPMSELATCLDGPLAGSATKSTYLIARIEFK